MTNSKKCPVCGKPKKSWFKLCYECNEKEKQKPVCEVCGIEIPNGWFLCNNHYKERKEKRKDLYKIKYVKQKKEMAFQPDKEGHYNSYRCKCSFVSLQDLKRHLTTHKRDR